MISPELARKVRYIQIYTSKTVNDVLAGEYHSVFKGRGMEFEEVREYQPGDEVRTIDWNVTARTGKPHVKRFREERELTIMFMVDLSASGAFGSIEQTKNSLAAELCALLAFAAIKNNDKVGLILFTDRIELFIPPAKGAGHVLRVIADVLAFQPKSKGTSIAGALDYVGRVMHKRAILFLVSDFRDTGYERPMRTLAKRHDLISIAVTDPREESLPNAGLCRLRDPESGYVTLVDTSSPAVRAAFAIRAQERLRELRNSFASMGVDQIAVSTDPKRDYVKELLRFFRARGRRMA